MRLFVTKNIQKFGPCSMYFAGSHQVRRDRPGGGAPRGVRHWRRRGAEDRQGPENEL